MNHYRASLGWLILAFLVVVLAGCQTTKNVDLKSIDHDPEAVFLAFVDAAESGDWRDVSKYASRPDQDYIHSRRLMAMDQKSSILTPPLAALTEFEVTEMQTTGNYTLALVNYSMNYSGNEIVRIAMRHGNTNAVGLVFGGAFKANPKTRSNDEPFGLVEKSVPWFLVQENSGWRMFLNLPYMVELEKIERQAEAADRSGKRPQAIRIYRELLSLEHPIDSFKLGEINRYRSGLFATYNLILEARERAQREISRLENLK